MLHDDFEFSSPHDPMLGIEDYFQKCWPFHKKADEYRIDTLMENENELFVIYTSTTNEGNKFENVEYFQIASARIKKIRVFYGTLSK